MSEWVIKIEINKVPYYFNVRDKGVSIEGLQDNATKFTSEQKAEEARKRLHHYQNTETIKI